MKKEKTNTWWVAIFTLIAIMIFHIALDNYRINSAKVELLNSSTQRDLITENMLRESDIKAFYKNFPKKEIKGDDYIIEETIKFLKKHEGVKYEAYHDFKQYSICYGMKSYKGAVATQKECDTTLKERVQSELLRINRFADGLKPEKKIALISFYYNVGFQYNVMDYAKRGDDDSVVYLMNKYVMAGGQYSKGLAKRRGAEILIYNS